MTQPEQLARENIDRLLTAAGWHVCDGYRICSTAITKQASKAVAGHAVQVHVSDARMKCSEPFDDYFSYDPNQCGYVCEPTTYTFAIVSVAVEGLSDRNCC